MFQLKLNSKPFLFFLIGMCAFLLIAASPMQATPPTLPDALVLVITVVLTAAVTEGVKEISTWLSDLFQTNIDISGAGAALATVIVGLVISSINGLLGSIPEPWWPVAAQVLLIISMIVGAIGTYRLIRGKKPTFAARQAARIR